MVVLDESQGYAGLPHTPLLPGEEARICETCKRIGIASPIRGRSTFRRARNWYASSCRACQRARLESSPEEQDARIDAWEEREAAGESLPTPRRRRQGSPGASPVVPIGPFRDWLHVRIAEALRNPDATQDGFAGRLGTDGRTLRRWLHGAEGEIEEERVDAVLSYEEGWMLSDIYPEKNAKPAPGPKRTSAASKKKPSARCCASKGCSKRARDGRFCHQHAAQLAEIRAGLEDEGRQMSSQGGAPLGKPRKRPTVPTCCRNGCWEPRMPGETFCIECQAMGYAEGEE